MAIIIKALLVEGEKPDKKAYDNKGTKVAKAANLPESPRMSNGFTLEKRRLKRKKKIAATMER